VGGQQGQSVYPVPRRSCILLCAFGLGGSQSVSMFLNGFDSMNYHPWVHYFLVYHILPLYGIVCTAEMATTQHASPYCGGYLGQSQASVLRTRPRAGILIRPVLRGWPAGMEGQFPPTDNPPFI
jgi:hypothetical protein